MVVDVRIGRQRPTLYLAVGTNHDNPRDRRLLFDIKTRTLDERNGVIALVEFDDRVFVIFRKVTFCPFDYVAEAFLVVPMDVDGVANLLANPESPRTARQFRGLRLTLENPVLEIDRFVRDAIMGFGWVRFVTIGFG